MSKEQRAAYRRQQKEEANRKGVEPENVIYEENIEDLRQAVNAAIPSLNTVFVPENRQVGIIDVPTNKLALQTPGGKPKGVKKAWEDIKNTALSNEENFEAGKGLQRMKPIPVVDNGNGTYTIIGEEATASALASHGATNIRVQTMGKNAGNPLANSAYLVETGTPGADADGELRTKGLEGLSKEEAKERAFEQAKENIPMLKKLVAAAAKAAGGEVKMRPANKENGQETKAPSTAFSKAERDYGGDIACVVDLIGGTCVLNKESSYADAVEAIRASLPEGSRIVRVKKLGFNSNVPSYQDLKVSVRFANGGIGEIIIVDEFIQDAKFNRGGHAIYELSRVLEPYTENENIEKALEALKKLSSAIYSSDVDEEAFARAKDFASRELQRLRDDDINLLSSSGDIMVVKSSSSLLNAAKPASVNSAAIPSSSEIEKDISEDKLAESGSEVKKENVGDSVQMLQSAPKYLNLSLTRRITDVNDGSLDVIYSKNQLLNHYLRCQRERYKEQAEEQGWTPEVMDEIREFLGEDVIAFGEMMRAELNASGLKEVFEEREGIPFASEANYWPASFDLSDKIMEKDALQEAPPGSATNYTMLIRPVRHSRDFDMTQGATNVFLANIAMHNNYICVGNLTRKWRMMLAHKRFAQGLKLKLGANLFQSFKQGLNLLDGSGIADAASQRAVSFFVKCAQSAHAMSVLALAPTTIFKQTTGVLNAKGYGRISLMKYFLQIAKDRLGLGHASYAEVAALPAFAARHTRNKKFLNLLSLGRDFKWSSLDRLARYGTDAIEWMDIKANLEGMTALYNITWERLQKANAGATDKLSETAMKEECERMVTNALELAAQPLRQTQKSLFASLPSNPFVKTVAYMGSDAISKIGFALAHGSREQSGAKGFWKTYKFIAGFSVAEQLTVMAIELFRNAGLDDDDDWASFIFGNAITAFMGLSFLNFMPGIGSAAEKAGNAFINGVKSLLGFQTDKRYIRTGSFERLVVDYDAIARTFNKFSKMSRDSEKYRAEDWALATSEALRAGTGLLAFLTGGKTNQFASSTLALLQTLNAAGNAMRPFLQFSRSYREKQDPEYKQKQERKQWLKRRKEEKARRKKEIEEILEKNTENA